MESSQRHSGSTQREKRRLTSRRDRAILFRCLGFLRPYVGYIVSALVLLFFIQGVTLALPQFVRFIVDRGIAEADVTFLGRSVLLLLALVAMKGILTFLQGRFSEVASQNVAYDLRSRIQKRLTFLSFSYHDQTESGQLLSSAMQDVERVRFLTGRASLRIVEALVLLVVTIILMFAMSPVLAALALVLMPLLVYRATAFGRLVRPLSRKVQDRLADMTSKLEQNLRGASVVKVYTQEEREMERFLEKNDAWLDASIFLVKIRSIHEPLLTFLADVATGLAVWVGGYLIIEGSLSYGELVAFTTYFALLAGPVRAMGRIVPIVGMAIASGERIFEILDAESEVKDAPEAYDLPPLRGEVEFRDVSFSYADRSPALEDVSFRVTPGETVALLGTTGSGKSTILNLIPRFYNPSEGRVLLDGHDVTRVRIESLREQIGIVLQETMLFATTVRENIRFGRPEAEDDEVEAAARAAQAHDFIMQMPEGYEAHVGETGRTLSGGQKQRIAIARAILKDPRILLFDDATSSVDTETERLIQRALENLMAGRTSFVIAQRLSTLRLADRVIVLESGRIQAIGTHEALYERSPLYKNIYDRQFRDMGGEETTERVS